MGRYLELEPESSLGWDGQNEPEPESAEESGETSPVPQQSWIRGAMLALLTGCGLVFFVLKWGSHAAPNQPLATLPTTNFETKAVEIYVDVKGAVHQPGVVRLPAGSRAVDAIKKCGGFTEKANRMAVNLAAKVHDEEMIRVPLLGEAVPTPTPSPVISDDSLPIVTAPSDFPHPPKKRVDVEAQLTPAPAQHFEGGIVDAIDSPHPIVHPSLAPRPKITPADVGGPPELNNLPPPPVPEAPPVAKGAQLSINRATVEQLSNVPGMTARLAADVVAYRRGPPPRAFTSLDELSKVPTLDQAKIDQISPYLKL